MGLRRSPLFAALGAAGGIFVERDGWLRADSFGSVARECAAVRQMAGLFDRSNRGTVSMQGRDTRRFCNGMFSNNIRDLKGGRTNRNVMLDDKGRVQGQLEIWCLEENHLLVTLEGVEAPAFIERYDRYIIADDVEQEDLSEGLVQLSLQGPKAAEILATLGLPVPEAGTFASVEALRVARRDRTVAGGYDLLVPVEQAVTLWTALLAAGASAVGEEAQEALRIEAGQARWPVDMGEKSLVHELRMVEQYCNFNKGCYIGQEVINRIDVMGQVQKKLYGLELGIDAIPPAGAEVLLEGQVVGQVASGAREGSRVRVLSVLRKNAWKPGITVEIQAGGKVAPAVVHELPFTG